MSDEFIFDVAVSSTEEVASEYLKKEGRKERREGEMVGGRNR